MDRLILLDRAAVVSTLSWHAFILAKMFPKPRPPPNALEFDESLCVDTIATEGTSDGGGESGRDLARDVALAEHVKSGAA